MVYFLCFLVILIGLYGVLTRKNIVKIAISLVVMEYGIHLFLVLVGYRSNGVPPIMDASTDKASWIQRSVDPLPQALVLTSIVIGLGVVSLMVALAIRLHEQYGTLDIREIRKLRG